ncbi:MAG: T9SS type A sorting domain-containing protein [Bacteroidia bacterium]|nr:T9SS type A sorting domain-containing protein [Bacteroidia bacterium]
MKFSKLFGSILLLVLTVSVKSQTCSYTLTNNYSISKDTDLVYKTIEYFNVSTLKYDTIDLKMDIIKPVGDYNTQRPIVIYFHGMNEPYKYTQLHVKRMVDVMVKERGFLLASVDYKFWHYPYLESVPAVCSNSVLLPFGFAQPYDTCEGVRSVFRVVQDANDAIKFVKARNYMDSSCVNLCFLAGFSAGGLVATSTTFLSQTEKPLQTFSISSADYTNFFGTPLNPTVSIPRGDLGVCTGSLTNGYNTEIKGVAIFNSGIRDLSYIKTGDAPIFIYHSTNDPNIPADSSAPACFTEPKMYGQNAIMNRALNQGYVLNSNLVLTNGATSHDFYNTQIRPAADFFSEQITNLQCQCDTMVVSNVSEFENKDLINIFTFENRIMIDSKLIHNEAVVKLYDLLGKEVFHEKIQLLPTQAIEVNVPKGIYLVHIFSNGVSKVEKVQLNLTN